MKTIAISRFGPPDVLQVEERPVPTPAAGEVLIEVRASGINRPDVLQRLGAYAPPPGASDLPGLEVAGVVTAVGPGLGAELVGREVCALVAGGGYAEYCAAPWAQCLPIPRGLSFLQACAVVETGFTVWHNVFERGALKSGEVLLVQGGSSGIGTTAIMLAKARGAVVIATAGSDEKCQACSALGADLVINYKNEDFVEKSKSWLMQSKAGTHVNVVLDMVAGDYLNRELELLGPDGRLVVIATQAGAKAEINASLLMQKRIVLTGSTLRPRSLEFKAALAQVVLRELWPLLEEGRCLPQIHSVFAPQDAAKAHSLMESSQHVGKLVVDWQLN